MFNFFGSSREQRSEERKKRALDRYKKIYERLEFDYKILAEDMYRFSSEITLQDDCELLEEIIKIQKKIDYLKKEFDL